LNIPVIIKVTTEYYISLYYKVIQLKLYVKDNIRISETL